MFICVCNAVTDREVRAAIESGCRTRDEVTTKCHAGGDCGSCHHMIEEMVEEHEEKLIAATSLLRDSVRERAA